MTQQTAAGQEVFDFPFDETKADNWNYLKAFWLRVTTQLKDVKNNPIEILKTVDEHLDRALRDRATPHSIFFFDSALPTVVRTLLSRKYPDDQRGDKWVRKTVQFLGKYQTVVVNLIREGTHTDAMFDVLHNTLSQEQSLYRSHGADAFTDALRPEFHRGGARAKFFILDEVDDQTSVYFAYMVHELGEKGFFAGLLERVNSRENKLRSSSLNQLIISLQGVAHILPLPFIQPYVVQVDAAVRNHINALTDAEMRDEAQNLEDLYEVMGHVAVCALGGANNDELFSDIQKYRMQLSLRYFRLPYIAPSIKGLEAIRHATEVAQGLKAENSSFRKVIQPFGYQKPAVKVPVPLPKGVRRATVTAANVLKWLDANEILPHILQSDNPGMLKAGADVVFFLVKHGGLTVERLDMLWNAVVHRHESVQAELFALFLRLADIISAENIIAVMERLHVLPPSQFSVQVLTFVSELARVASKREDLYFEGASPEEHAIDTLWDVLRATEGVHEGAGISAGVVRETCDDMQNMLTEFPKLKGAAIRRIMENLKAGRIVTVSLRLLSFLLPSYPAAERSGVIERLDKDHKVVDAILADLGRCATAPPTPSAVVAKGEASGALQERLHSLELLLTGADLNVTNEQAGALWDHVYTVNEDLGYNWFFKIAQYRQVEDPYDHTLTFPAFRPAVEEYLFREKICALDPSMLSVNAVKLIGIYFLNVNARQRKIRRVDGVGLLRVRKHDLAGLESLWAAAFGAAEPQVADYALTLLRAVWTGASRSVPSEEQIAWRKSFADRAVHYLSGKTHAVSSEEMQSRALYLLSEAVGRPPRQVDEAFVASHFEALFGLLASGSENVRNLVWSLITRLPTHPGTAGAVEKLAFKEVMPAPKAPLYTFRVLYFLRALENRFEDNAWVNRFVETNGLAFLVALLRDEAVVGNGEVGRSAAAILGGMVHRLIASGRIPPSALASSIDASFVHIVMGQIAAVADAPRAAALDGVAGVRSVDPGLASCWEMQVGGIANCLYGPKRNHMRFEVRGCNRYRVSMYTLDYQELNRSENIFAFVSDDATLATKPADAGARRFIVRAARIGHGLWVTWDVHTTTANSWFNVVFDKAEGGDWVCSAILLDRASHKSTAAEPEIYPPYSFDEATQGRWWGRYGRCGGWFVGPGESFLESSYPEGTPGVPRFGKKHTAANAYSWISKLSTDPRTVRIPPPDLRAVWSDVDESDDENANAAATSGSLTSAKAGRTLSDLLFSATHSAPSLVPAVTAYPNFRQWLAKALVFCPDEGLRSGVHDGVARMEDGVSEDVKAAMGEIREAVLALVPEVEQLRARAASFDELFMLAQTLLLTTPHHPEALLSTLTRLVTETAATEPWSGEPVDTLLTGVLNLAAHILSHNPQLRSKAQHVLFESAFLSLFAYPTSQHDLNLPKCKSARARAAAQAVLIALCGARDHRDALIRSMEEQVRTTPLSEDDWELDVEAPGGAFARGPYTGLKNQGCTCYMNASLQQLFQLPHLRNSILSVHVTLPEAAAKAGNVGNAPAIEAATGTTGTTGEVVEREKTEEERKEENIMYQLQLLFGSMGQTRASYVDTIGFCRTLKLNGEPIRIGQQEDANEFLNSLVDQLEPWLKKTPQERIFRDTFGGTLLQEVLPLEGGCNHVSERDEDFLTISVKVQGKRNLAEGLEAFVAGDILDGDNAYHCEQCDSKIPAKKRAVIKHLPNHLALHLIRFEFSFETMGNIKVDDRYEFPDTLDMRPYTREGLAEQEGRKLPEECNRPKDYYTYKLVGVLVHSGTAQSGHYYSYIRERGEGGRWFEFNDRRVTLFSREELPELTFGGVHENTNRSKIYSAYMLFYDREQRYPAREYCSVPLPPPEIPRGLEDAGIEARIWRSNVEMLRREHMMSKSSLDFMWQVTEQSDADSGVVDDFRDAEEKVDGVQFAAIQLGTRLVMDVYARCTSNSSFIVARAARLQKMFEKHMPSCKWLLEMLSDPKGGEWLRNVMVECPEQATRSAVADLLSLIVERVALADPRAEKPTVKLFIDACLKLFKGNKYYPAGRHDELASVVLRFAKIHEDYQRFLNYHLKAIMTLLQLYTNHRTPVHSQEPNPAHVPLLELVSLLACGFPPEIEFQRYEEQHLIPVDTHRALFAKMFLQTTLGQHKYHDSMSRIILYWSADSKETTNKVVEALFGGAAFSCYSIPMMKEYYSHVLDLWKLGDAEVEWRHKRIIVEIMRTMVLKQQGPPYLLDATLDLLCEVCELSPEQIHWLEHEKPFATLLRQNPDVAVHIRDHHVKFGQTFPLLMDLINEELGGDLDGDDDVQ